MTQRIARHEARIDDNPHREARPQKAVGGPLPNGSGRSSRGAGGQVSREQIDGGIVDDFLDAQFPADPVFDGDA